MNGIITIQLISAASYAELPYKSQYNCSYLIKFCIFNIQMQAIHSNGTAVTMYRAALQVME